MGLQQERLISAPTKCCYFCNYAEKLNSEMVSIILSACSLSAPSKQSVCWQLSLWKTQSSLLETEGPGTDKYRWANMPENNTTSSSSAVSWVMNTSPDSSAMAPLFSSEADATDLPYFVIVVVTPDSWIPFCGASAEIVSETVYLGKGAYFLVQ